MAKSKTKPRMTSDELRNRIVATEIRLAELRRELECRVAEQAWVKGYLAGYAPSKEKK